MDIKKKFDSLANEKPLKDAILDFGPDESPSLDSSAVTQQRLNDLAKRLKDLNARLDKLNEKM